MKKIQVHTAFTDFQNDPNDELYLIKTDQKRFQQVLLNLYSNAIKFTERDGEIKIQVALKRCGEQGERQMLHIEVQDNGLGIKEEDKPNIFKQFSSFKDPKRGINTKGIGLGLVICKMIVEKFNGRIGFRSKHN